VGVMEERDETSTLHLRWRVEARDAKLNAREELVAADYLQGFRICKCNICVGENRSLRRRDVVEYHLSQYGRAPFLRGSTNVRS
jgi:hypothetical protein